MEPRGRLIPMFRRTAAQPLDTEDLDSSGPEVADASGAAPARRLLRRILFRIAFAYIVLYHFPFPLSYVPYVKLIHTPYQALMDVIVLWTGKYLFHTEIQIIRPNGSGDSTFAYVRVFCFAALAVAAALVWTLLDRKRRNHARLHEWLRVYVRFALAAAMLSYGAAKVLPSQFAVTPSLDALLQPLGQFSPMGLLWNFMAASLGYTIFGGLSEMIG